MKYLALLVLAISCRAESLQYTINWPSGLSLGSASISSAKTAAGWQITLDIDASVPGFPIRDHDEASATADFCSTKLDKSFTHGSHKVDERLTFDQQTNTVTRETLNGGGKTETSASACARDALTFLEFARHELEGGRVAAEQQVFFGAPYTVRLQYAGTETIKIMNKMVEADRMLADIQGPASSVRVDLYFSRDAARTPLLARMPLALGTFSVELTQ